MSFDTRIATLPHLGLGISTEYGASSSPGALKPLDLRARAPRFASFLEVGLEHKKGLDGDAEAWLGAGLPTTYHFLDVNLDQPASPGWMEATAAAIERIRPAWLCGDSGWWHWGPAEPAQMLLLPPVLTRDAAKATAEGVARLREALGVEVVPENPPGLAWLGDLHLLDFYAAVCEEADCGLLLDVAHLAIYQRMTGNPATTALDGFPLERIVEIHVAGGTDKDHEGLAWVDDDHGLSVLPESWAVVEAVAPGARNLKAVVAEAERNSVDAVLPLYEAIERRFEGTPFGEAGR